RGAGMAPGIAEHLDHQVGGAVDDLRLLGEARHGVDEAAEPDDTQDAVEIAVERASRLGEEVQAAEPRRRLAVLEAHLGAELADIAPLAVPLADLAGDEKQ